MIRIELKSPVDTSLDESVYVISRETSTSAAQCSVVEDLVILAEDDKAMLRELEEMLHCMFTDREIRGIVKLLIWHVRKRYL